MRRRSCSCRHGGPAKLPLLLLLVVLAAASSRAQLTRTDPVEGEIEYRRFPLQIALLLLAALHICCWRSISVCVFSLCGFYVASCPPHRLVEVALKSYHMISYLKKFMRKSRTYKSYMYKSYSWRS